MAVHDQKQYAKIHRIKRALGIVAELVEVDPIYTPIFLRLDSELRSATSHDDAASRVRARLARN